MKYLKVYESFNQESVNDLIVYHGGENILTDDNLIDKPLFTTNELESVNWYLRRSGDISWLTTMSITINNPLTCNNKEEFKNKWIPIIDESGINYSFKDYGQGWSFESYDIIKNGGYIENNINDLIYIDKFVEIAKKNGYDGIIGYDTMENYTIKIFIPFYKRNIKIISSERIQFH